MNRASMNELVAVTERCWLQVASVVAERRSLTIRFAVWPPPDDGKTIPTWVVSCNQVRDFSLTDFNGGGLNFWDDDHPLLQQFRSPKASLSIAVGKRPQAECAGVLLRAHHRLVGDWIEFERFMRRRPVWERAERPFALTGPEFLLRGYYQELVGSGFRARLKKHKRALYWSGVGWGEQKYRVAGLHFGNSYIVAESFSATPEPAMLPDTRPAKGQADSKHSFRPPRVSRGR